VTDQNDIEKHRYAGNRLTPAEYEALNAHYSVNDTLYDMRYFDGSYWVRATPATILALLFANSGAIQQNLRFSNARGIRAYESSGDARLLIDATPLDGTSTAETRIFRDTNTTGIRRFTIFKGDGSATQMVFIEADTGSIYIAEKASADADNAGFGQLWIKNATPCELWFTDDAGTDTQIV